MYTFQKRAVTTDNVDDMMVRLSKLGVSLVSYKSAFDTPR